jgi:hypothetical protein
MSYENTKGFLSEISPFSKIVSSVFNDSEFLNTALLKLDKYIDKHTLPLSAEDILITIADGNWALPNCEINLYPDLISDQLPRLKKSCEQGNFREEFRECSVDSDSLEYTLHMRVSIFVDDEYYLPFFLLNIANRLKTKYNITHTSALSLIAVVFGFSNSNDLTRFDLSLKHALLSWTITGFTIVPQVAYFDAVKKYFDLKYLNGVDPSEVNDCNNTFAYQLAFFESQLSEHYIPDMVSAIDNYENTKKWALNSEIFAEPVDDIFYSQLTRLCWKKDLTPEKSKELIVRNIFMKNIVRAVIFSYQLVYGMGIFPHSPEKEITGLELQYRWLENLVKGSQLMLDESQKLTVKSLQEAFGNQFEDFRLPAPLNMYDWLNDVL